MQKIIIYYRKNKKIPKVPSSESACDCVRREGEFLHGKVVWRHFAKMHNCTVQRCKTRSSGITWRLLARSLSLCKKQNVTLWNERQFCRNASYLLTFSFFLKDAKQTKVPKISRPPERGKLNLLCRVQILLLLLLLPYGPGWTDRHRMVNCQVNKSRCGHDPSGIFF